MAGLDYGRTYKNQGEKKVEGVSLGKNGKWLVRIKKLTTGPRPKVIITTLAQYIEEKDAHKRFKKEIKDPNYPK